MRQVRTCDFCGDDAAGVYEPLPSSVPGAPRMLLCEACRDRLSTVVDPLLDAVEGELDTGPEGRGDRARRPEGPGEPAAVSGDGDPAVGGDASVDRPTGDRSGDGRENRAQTTDPGDGEEQEAASSPTGPASDDPERTDVGTEDSTGAPSFIEDLADDAEAESGAAVGESRDAGGRTQSQREGAPRGYRKVMRFLENRSFPMDRAQAEDLAAEAYDLDESAVADAIDHAVEFGRLREVSGELRR